MAGNAEQRIAEFIEPLVKPDSKVALGNDFDPAFNTRVNEA
jgi:hypothetical protein